MILSQVQGSRKLIKTKTAGYILLTASLLFLGRSFFEAYVLTPSRGPQMIFFSLIHVWPSWLVGAFFASWFAYYLYLIFAGVISILGFSPRLRSAKNYIAFIRTTFIICGIHFILLLTYDKWSYALFSAGGNHSR
jgi:hypothetical protein